MSESPEYEDTEHRGDGHWCSDCQEDGLRTSALLDLSWIRDEGEDLRDRLYEEVVRLARARWYPMSDLAQASGLTVEHIEALIARDIIHSGGDPTSSAQVRERQRRALVGTDAPARRKQTAA